MGAPTERLEVPVPPRALIVSGRLIGERLAILPQVIDDAGDLLGRGDRVHRARDQLVHQRVQIGGEGRKDAHGIGHANALAGLRCRSQARLLSDETAGHRDYGFAGQE